MTYEHRLIGALDEPLHPPYTIDYSSFVEAIAGMSQAFQNASKAMAKQSRRMQWELRVLFADTAKERRLLRRDMAREYRRPSLIHNGGKP